MYGRILIPLDGSVCGEHALKEGAQLAKKLGAEVTLLHAARKWCVRPASD